MNKKNGTIPKIVICAFLILFSLGFIVQFPAYDLANKIFTVCFVLITIRAIVWVAHPDTSKTQSLKNQNLFIAFVKWLLTFSVGCLVSLVGLGLVIESSSGTLYFAWLVLILGTLLILYAILQLIFKIYEFFYYKGKGFWDIKNRIQSYINDCNELNEHIENLKVSSLLSNQTDYGQATYYDSSRWKYKRKYLANQKYAPNIHNCSRNVCDNARRKPFEYVCKYFGIKANEENLSQVENILNNFEAAEDGKDRLQKEKVRIIESIKTEIPFLIRTFSKQLDSKLGFEEVDMSTSYFPEYIFQYISSGGNASMQCDVVFDIDNLNKFVVFLSKKVNFKKSVAGQRALMTSKLREKIKIRDDYTCKICGNSIKNEPNLLLEIDHIIPVSKGGLTIEDNLQTLCWRCNRSKGAKIS